MPLKVAPFIRACCVVGALAVSVLWAADRPASLLGSSRSEVISRLGEPKSQIVVGNRQVLFFSVYRIELRDGRVIAADEIAPDAPPPAATKSASTTGASADTGTAAATDQSTSPARSSSSSSSTAAITAADTSDSSSASATGAPVPPATPPPAPVQEVIIKSVRPPSAARSPAEISPPQPSAPASPTAQPPVAKAQPPAVTPASGSSVLPAASVPTADASVQSRPTANAESTAPSATLTDSSEGQKATDAVATPADAEPKQDAPVPPKKAKAKRDRAGADGPAVESADSLFSTQTYVIIAIIVVGGVAYLVWRHRQRQMLLAVSTVSQSPFPADTRTTQGSGGRFTSELLGRLEWKRFEELVAAYYNKTGVVATRTKTGPAAAVQIRISWKGEQRPFACVRCLPHPGGLVDVTAVQGLWDAIAAEDIRRGYVVTTGKFNVPARDFAEEKHITLLPGDIFLEKLNTLPDAARAELLNDATVGDYTTPTCPKCDLKLSRSPQDPSIWRCPQCGFVLPQA